MAAVDFQYIGGGVGVKDLAYFIGSCLYEEDCERYEKQLLDYYFSALKAALHKQHSSINFSDLFVYTLSLLNYYLLYSIYS